MSFDGWMEGYVGLSGAIIGSFANVCIYRIPAQRAIVSPRSMCDRCGSVIRFYDNIPILSYFCLGGRCRRCGVGISLQYPFVEALHAVSSVYLYRTFGFSWIGMYLFLLVSALIIASAIDFRHRIIPDGISISGTWIGLAMAGLAQWLGFEWLVTFPQSVTGALFGFLLLWGVGKIYHLLTSRDGIGFGDVKLLALFGAHSGIEGVLTSLFYGSLLGAVAGGSLILFQGKGRRYPIPFGPFLCLGLLAYGLSGERAIQLITSWVLPR